MLPFQSLMLTAPRTGLTKVIRMRGGTTGAAVTSSTLMRFARLADMVPLQCRHADCKFIHLGNAGQRTESTHQGDTLAWRQIARRHSHHHRTALLGQRAIGQVEGLAHIGRLEGRNRALQ